jgi:hypothetical protein
MYILRAIHFPRTMRLQGHEAAAKLAAAPANGNPWTSPVHNPSFASNALLSIQQDTPNLSTLLLRSYSLFRTPDQKLWKFESNAAPLTS